MMIAELTADDRAYILNRVDRDHCASVARQVRERLQVGEAAEACYMPGDGTYYALLFTPRPAVVGAGGGGSAGHAPHSYLRATIAFVSYLQSGASVAIGEVCDFDWAAGELTDNAASGLAIAELFREVFA